MVTTKPPRTRKGTRDPGEAPPRASAPPVPDALGALAFERADVVLVGYDRAGRVAIANERARRELGAGRPAGVVGRLAWEILPGESEAAFGARWDRLQTEGELVVTTPATVRGDARWFQRRVRLGEGAEGPLAIEALVDVTDRKRAEEGLAAQEIQLRQAVKMQAVGQLAGGIAHDFNNLLSVIISYAGFVGEAVRDPDLAADVEEIRKAGHRAAALTRQLLAFSRKSQVTPQVLELDRVLREMEKLLLRTLGEHVELRIVSAPGLWHVKIDPGSVEQIVMNLTINGRDAMPDGGTITVTLANVDIDPERAARFHGVLPGPYVELAVADTGVGMTRDVQARLFEPFFTTKQAGYGTGLGLATVLGIVSRAGGHIDVTSEPGKGSRFCIYLPRTVDRPDGQRARAVADRSEIGKGRTVLVVEDEVAVRSLVSRILAKAGFRVIEAGGGGDALALFERHAGEVDLVLTDVIMPQMSGKAVAGAIATQKPGQRVVYMSGYTDDIIAPHGVLEAGVMLLHKPFSEADLLKIVQRAMVT
jgi:PAS domain S-box-containing protein